MILEIVKNAVLVMYKRIRIVLLVQLDVSDVEVILIAVFVLPDFSSILPLKNVKVVQ